jgi:hypothetical protein
MKCIDTNLLEIVPKGEAKAVERYTPSRNLSWHKDGTSSNSSKRRRYL